MGFDRNNTVVAIIMAMIASAAAAQAPAPAPAPNAAPAPGVAMPAPKLIIAISVDQFSSDLFGEYRAKLPGAFKRLQTGVVFSGGYQGHAATETCPGHATIMSGIHPARSGIAANDWFGTRAAKFDEIYCVEDESVSGSSHDDYTVSLAHLSPDFQTLGDRLKADPARRTRVFAVSGKDRGATLMAGRADDETFWYDWRARGFTTYVSRKDRPVDKTIPLLKPVNARIAAWIAKPTAPPPLPKPCVARIDAITTPSVTFGGGVEAMPRTDKPDNTAKDFRATRALDIATIDIAQSMITANQLGRRDSIDVLAISLSGTDYIGHAYGTEGPEMCAQLQSIDARLEAMFAALDKAKTPYMVMLTADHGGFDAPERHDNHAYPAADRATGALGAASLGTLLNQRYGWSGQSIANRGIGGDYYFTDLVPADKRAEAAAWLKATLVAGKNPELAAVFTKADLAAVPIPSGDPSQWTLAERARASFVPDRSGDLYIVLRHGLMAIPTPARGYVATHGSAWDYDRRVPIIFYWPGARGFEQPFGVATVDILPTLASTIGLPVAAGSVDGRCLDLIAGPRTNCPN